MRQHAWRHRNHVSLSLFFANALQTRNGPGSRCVLHVARREPRTLAYYRERSSFGARKQKRILQLRRYSTMQRAAQTRALSFATCCCCGDFAVAPKPRRPSDDATRVTRSVSQSKSAKKLFTMVLVGSGPPLAGTTNPRTGTRMLAGRILSTLGGGHAVGQTCCGLVPRDRFSNAPPSGRHLVRKLSASLDDPKRCVWYGTAVKRSACGGKRTEHILLRAATVQHILWHEKAPSMARGRCPLVAGVSFGSFLPFLTESKAEAMRRRVDAGQ